jgi:hypothetical protein
MPDEWSQAHTSGKARPTRRQNPVAHPIEMTGNETQQEFRTRPDEHGVRLIGRIGIFVNVFAKS